MGTEVHLTSRDWGSQRPLGDATIGHWAPGVDESVRRDETPAEVLRRIDLPLHIVGMEGCPALTSGGTAMIGGNAPEGTHPLFGHVPACRVSALGDPAFCADHGIRYAYVSGAMANGIACEELVETMARAGMLSFFGAAGLSVPRIEAAIDRVQENIGDLPYGFNLIHSPNEAGHEDAVVDLYLRRGIRLVEASAFLGLTLAVVRYRVTGIHRDESGTVVAPNSIIAKVSRVEIATHFMSPPPDKLLRKLVESADITRDQADMAQEIPMAPDVTAEADSGGHTDHRPAVALLPTLLALRDRLQSEHGYKNPLRVGLAGGISTPASAAAAFAMGAAYVLTGSVNQACVEAGTSDAVRGMLAAARQADVANAPAADMFEMGVTVQVLKRGTMFAMRASKLYELYRAHGSLEEIPGPEREKLEKTAFRAPLEEIWERTRAFFSERDPKQIERAARDPKHKMALVFRWYLGQSSIWANSGHPERTMDYQVWCGPGMGAFNEWVKGSFLEQPENRGVVTVAYNILYGAAVMQRIQSARSQGFEVPAEAYRLAPLTEEELTPHLAA